MKAIYLHGELKDQFGEVFFFDAKDPAEAIRALCVQIAGFEKAIQTLEFKLVKGPLDRAVELTERSVAVGFGKIKEIHLIPRLALGKKAGAGKFLVGILLVAACFAIPAIALGGGLAAMGGSSIGISLGALGTIGVKFSTIALFGLSMALGGLSQMLSPTPKTAETGDKDKSHLLNGVPNLYEQGNPVPLAYGLKVLVGSISIATAVVTYDTAGSQIGYPGKGISPIEGSEGSPDGAVSPVNPSNPGGGSGGGVTWVPGRGYDYNPDGVLGLDDYVMGRLILGL